MQPVNLFFSLMIISNFFLSAQTTRDIMLCYGEFNPMDVKGYDYVIIEPNFFDEKDISMLRADNKLVLAYISLGEVNENSPFFAELMHHTLGENKIWKSRILDLESIETFEKLDSLITHYRTMGFDGIFMDNIDNYTIWGPTPDKQNSLLNFLKHLRKKDPEIHLMQNGGIQLIEKTSSLINSLAVESVATDYDLNNREYHMRNKEGFTERFSMLLDIKKHYNLSILLIEYADSGEMKDQILKRYKKLDWPIFIGNIELNSFPNF